MEILIYQISLAKDLKMYQIDFFYFLKIIFDVRALKLYENTKKY